MKIHIGSIQRKGKRLYLVSRYGNKQQWLSLKTTDYKTAQMRARQLLPENDERITWLEHLSELGKKAEVELKNLKMKRTLCWGCLWDEFIDHMSGVISETSEESYMRWLHILEETANALDLSPADILSRESCMRIMTAISKKYLSARRMQVFFRRVWRALGLDPQTWSYDIREGESAGDKVGEYYRRLSLPEIRQVYNYLCKTNPDFADMILIGYSTGLRLSDVAELERSEISADASFIRLVPNKTNRHKPYPLTIPLTEQARSAIKRRISTIGEEDTLFPIFTRVRPSRKITSAFRKCNIVRHGTARASFHSLRATFISMMDEAGIPPHITDSITGHGGGGMHARYTQPSVQALQAAVNKAIPPL